MYPARFEKTAFIGYNGKFRDHSRESQRFNEQLEDPYYIYGNNEPSVEKALKDAGDYYGKKFQDATNAVKDTYQRGATSMMNFLQSIPEKQKKAQKAWKNGLDSVQRGFDKFNRAVKFLNRFVGK